MRRPDQLIEIAPIYVLSTSQEASFVRSMASPVEKTLSRSRSLLVDLTLLQKRRRGSNAISERVVQHEMRVRITNFLAFAFLDCAFAFNS
jgi:hypothetical protein